MGSEPSSPRQIRKAGSMTQYQSSRDLAYAFVWNVGLWQIRAQRSVEIELSLVDQLEHALSEYGFA
jgi:hypothetical protein